MSAPAPGRTGRALVLAGGALATAALALVATAAPAAAHQVEGGATPAPPWLLGYLGAAGVGATAVALRTARTRVVPVDGGEGTPAEVAGRGVPVRPAVRVGNVVGLLALAAVVGAAIVGPDDPAANVAPVATLVWWVAVPVLCLLLGDVVRVLNPLVPVVALVDRRCDGRDGDVGAPAWTGAAFLGAVGWFFVAYYRPGSPRAVAVLLAAYLVAAVAGGVVWGRRWLLTGEGFGALSAAMASIRTAGRRPMPTGAGPLAVVWIGTTAFDGLATTPFWADVVGANRGWTATLLNTVGLVWMIAIVAAVHLGALRVADRWSTAGAGAPRHGAVLAPVLAGALVAVGAAWFLAHDLTLLLTEGQNLLVLVSDPLGRGWDLLGTYDWQLDFGIAQEAWVTWLRIGLLGAGHMMAVAVARAVAVRHLRSARDAARATWLAAGVSAVSVVAAPLLVLG